MSQVNYGAFAQWKNEIDDAAGVLGGGQSPASLVAALEHSVDIGTYPDPETAMEGLRALVTERSGGQPAAPAPAAPARRLAPRQQSHGGGGGSWRDRIPHVGMPEFGSPAMVIGAVVVILLLIAAAVVISVSGSSSTPPSIVAPTAAPRVVPTPATVQAPPTPASDYVKPVLPKTQPIDLQHVGWLNPTASFFLIAWVLSMLWLFLDARARREMFDFVVMFVPATILVFLSWIGVLQALFREVRITDPRGLVFVSLSVLTAICLHSGRDLTPLGGFFKYLASAALVLGTMGAFESAFSLTPGPVLPLGQVLVYLQLMQPQSVWYSLWVYGLELLAVLIFAYEIIRPRRGAPEFGTALAALTVPVAYLGIRAVSGWSWLPVLLIANAMAVIVTNIGQQLGTDTGTSFGNTPYGALQITGLDIRTPWDGLLTGLVLLELIVMAMGAA